MDIKLTVTKEQIEDNMNNVIVRTAEQFGQPVTYVKVTMKNGFVLNEAIASDPDHYDEEADKEYCLKQIRIKIRLLLEYSLQEHLFKQKKVHKTFKPFQKVLVNIFGEDLDSIWSGHIYSHYDEATGRHYMIDGTWTSEDSLIIPYEGNEKLLGTIVE